MSEPNALSAPGAHRRSRDGTLLRQIFRWWKTQALIRRDLNYLRHQPDRILRDIGLLRVEFPDGQKVGSKTHWYLWTKHR